MSDPQTSDPDKACNECSNKERILRAVRKNNLDFAASLVQYTCHACTNNKDKIIFSDRFSQRRHRR